MVEKHLNKSLLDVAFVDYLALAVFNLALFSSAIDLYFGFSYADEFAMGCMVLVAGFRLLKEYVNKELHLPLLGMVSTVLLTSLVLIGLIGNFLWDVQGYPFAIVIDIVACIKFPLIVLCGLYGFNRCSSDLLILLEAEVKILSIVMLLLACVNLVYNFGMGGEVRYGLRSFFFVNGHPTGLVAMGVGMSLILLRDPRGNFPWILVLLLVIASSLRSKGFVYCLLMLIGLFVLRGGRRLNVIHIALCVVMGVMIGWDQYISYFTNEGYARTELSRACVEVAMDYFPIGPGFATFGSNITSVSQYYSVLYYMYDLSTVEGLIPGNATFLSDTFWPIVLGQFGFLGLAVFIFLMICLFKLCYDRAGTRRIVALCCFGYLLISSTAESAFFHPLAVSLAISMTLVIGERREDTPAEAEVVQDILA